ncbi:MAG: pyridoxamine 5'-phosphate oxidase family protein [Planctomycetota bacterium]|nr:pyridoxamine 5'-phosphate oxidase family protein [Planctomycetota bacterium]
MKRPVSDIAFTPSVKAVQERLGSRRGYSSMEQRGGWSDVVTPELAQFVAERDTMFIATVNAEGQPYIQHRGGPAGFLKVIDEHTLGFADFSGNRQYISVGNLRDNPKAFIFLMDFANRRRIKIWGRAEVVEDDARLRQKLYDPEYGSEPERMFLFHVDAWDVNCPQHIKPRFTEEEVGASMQALHDRIAQLEADCCSCEPKD